MLVMTVVHVALWIVAVPVRIIEHDIAVAFEDVLVAQDYLARRQSRVITAAATGTIPLYSFSMQNLPPSNLGPEKSFLWWRHPFYRLRWQQWHASWLELADTIPASHEQSPTDVLRRLKEVHCDPDVALRLAFLVASQKAAKKSELAGDNERQQRIKRKLSQARNHLLKAAFGLMEAALPEIAKGNKKQAQRKLAHSKNHILKAALELNRALSDIPLIFIKSEGVDSLKAIANVTDPQDVDLWMRLQSLAAMCDHEIETLLWARTIEPPPGHELFTLLSYVKACCGKPNFKLVNDLLTVAHEAYETDQPASDPHDKVKQFRKLDSVQPDLIEEYTALRAKSGELKRELLTYYPD